MNTFVAFKITIVCFGEAKIDIENFMNHRAKIHGLFESNEFMVFLAHMRQELAKNLLLDLPTNFIWRQISFVVHSTTHSRLDLIHGFLKSGVVLDGLHQRPPRIIQRVPQKVFETASCRKAQHTKDTQERRSLRKKRNVDHKCRRTS